jgi:biotin carboxylase
MRVLMLVLAPRWFGPPRLLRALHESGCRVATLSVAGSIIETSRFADARYALSDDAALRSADLLQAIESFEPDRLLPADELAVRWLHEQHGNDEVTPQVRALIATSLGDPSHYSRTTDKLTMGELAASLGVATPATANLARDTDAHDFIHAHGWPVVIKACAGYAGIAVFPCASLRDVRHALRECPGPKRLIQRYEDGMTWLASFVAERGRVLALVCAEKQRQHPPDVGPSTVLRFAHDAVMESACTKLIAALGYSGFGSVDFQKTADGRALFLEFNPRPTPVCHLGARLGVDLAAAYADGRDRDVRRLAAQRVALFPQELMRDATGAGLEGCWHDVPEDEPELLAAYEALLAQQTASAPVTT